MRPISVVLLLVGACLQAVRADEQQTFYGKTVDGWIAVLRARAATENERREAILALGYFGAEAKAVVPDLIEFARQERFKAESSEALACIGSRVEEPVPRLIEQFLRESYEHFTESGAVGFTTHATEALVRVGGLAVPALITVLNGPDRRMRVCAAEALGRIGPAAGRAVPVLIQLIEQPDNDPHAKTLRHYAVEALGRMGPNAKAAVPLLNRLLEEKLGDYYDVAVALEGIGAPPVRKLAERLVQVGDPSATELLAWLGRKAGDAIPALKDALSSERLQVRVSAAVALARVEPGADQAIPVLIEGLEHLEDRNLNVADLPRALAHFGPRAEAAMPILLRFATERDPLTDILKALVQIDPEGKRCVPALSAALQSEDDAVADTAAKCLGLLGPRAKDAVPALSVALTRDFNVFVDNAHDPQQSAVKALGRIGPLAKGTIPALMVALKHRREKPEGDFGNLSQARDCSVASAAAFVLGSFGREAKAAVPALIEAVQTREKDDENWSVIEAAALAFARIGPDAEPAVPVLRRLIGELADIGDGMPEVVIALYKLAPDGVQIAEKWLKKPFSAHPGVWILRQLERRALVLAAMGRTSVEGDVVTRYRLGRLNSMLAFSDPRDSEFDHLEGWFETFARLGVGARLAIPRLTEFSKHPDPWVRMWAGEALGKIKGAACAPTR